VAKHRKQSRRKNQSLNLKGVTFAVVALAIFGLAWGAMHDIVQSRQDSYYLAYAVLIIGPLLLVTMIIWGNLKKSR
jgi:hypothetical protein